MNFLMTVKIAVSVFEKLYLHGFAWFWRTFTVAFAVLAQDFFKQKAGQNPKRSIIEPYYSVYMVFWFTVIPRTCSVFFNNTPVVYSVIYINMAYTPPRTRAFLFWSLEHKGARQAAIPYMGNIHMEVRQDRVLSFLLQFFMEHKPVQKHSRHHPHNPHLKKFLRKFFTFAMLLVSAWRNDPMPYKLQV